jgi:two-component system, OmpR family, response regulator
MRILIVEDDSMLRESLQEILRRNGHVADSVEDIAHAETALQLHSFDLLLLDLGLPDGDGIAILSKLRQRQDSLLTLIITARDALSDRVKGLRTGADDYLGKPFETAELLARIDALGRRNRPISSNVRELGRLRVEMNAQRAWIGDEALELPAREWAVLNALIEHVDRIVPKERLISMVANWDDELSSNALETYVSRLRAKLEPAGLTVKTLRGLGYLLSATASPVR